MYAMTRTELASDGRPTVSHGRSGGHDPQRVMVVHGRNERARDALFTFLRSVGLRPIEWEQAVAETGDGSPHNLAAVRAAMGVAQAVIVLLTAEDEARLLPPLAEVGPPETPGGQPRQNVLIEAGLAIGIDASRTILVELGPVRRASDFDGLNVVRLSNEGKTRKALCRRLQQAGCRLDDSGTDWLGPSAGGDFETCLVPLQTGTVSARFAVAAARGHHLEAFAIRASDGAVIHSWWGEGEDGWSAWEERGMSGMCDVAAASWGGDHMQVFALHRDGTVWTCHWRNDASWWREWHPLSGHVQGPLSAASSTEGHVEVFARDADGAIVARAGDSETFERSWRQLHATPSRKLREQ
jgi:predicted nucleotide-binding protein